MIWCNVLFRDGVKEVLRFVNYRIIKKNVTGKGEKTNQNNSILFRMNILRHENKLVFSR